MRNPKRILLVTCLLLGTANSAFAGGVGSGGGGTTNPYPTDKERVAASVYHYGGSAILAWAKAEEANYRRMSETDRQNSPFKKLFDGEKTIYDVLKEAKVELRFNEPCYDSSGAPWDGSMYASAPGSVCLSPFTMAPKLNDTNVQEETLALVIHEFSHLLGTTEEEADEIQKQALLAFDGTDMVHFLTSPSLTAKWFEEALGTLNIYLLSPEFVESREMDDFLRELVEFRRQMTFDHSFSFSMLRWEEIEEFTANTVRFSAVRDYVCSVDPREHDVLRSYCLEKIERGFRGEEEVTARTYISRRDEMPEDIFGPEYERIVLRRIRDKEGVRGMLQEAKIYLESILATVKAQAEAEIGVVRN